MVGIVLGAGRLERLGRPKQTLPFGDTTLLGSRPARCRELALERVVAGAGRGRPATALAAIEPRGAPRWFEGTSAYGSGCASSLLAGLDAAGDGRRP